MLRTCLLLLAATFAALQAPLLNGTQVTLHTQGAQAPAVVHRLVSVLQVAMTTAIEQSIDPRPSNRVA